MFTNNESTILDTSIHINNGCVMLTPYQIIDITGEIRRLSKARYIPILGADSFKFYGITRLGERILYFKAVKFSLTNDTQILDKRQEDLVLGYMYEIKCNCEKLIALSYSCINESRAEGFEPTEEEKNLADTAYHTAKEIVNGIDTILSMYGYKPQEKPTQEKPQEQPQGKPTTVRDVIYPLISKGYRNRADMIATAFEELIKGKKGRDLAVVIKAFSSVYFIEEKLPKASELDRILGSNNQIANLYSRHLGKTKEKKLRTTDPDVEEMIRLITEKVNNLT